MKKTLVISCLSFFLSLGLAGCDDDSNDNGGGTNTPKVNGEACATADECASAYCDATTKKCAAKPAENPDDGGKKANGEACAKVDDCASGYCDAATMKCAEKPAEAGKKANGEACTKADDCTSAYCDATSKKCADKPAEAGKKANGEACTKADDCTSAYCDATSKKCADKPAESGDLKINEVPSTQDNTVGHKCDPDKFVEHCDGNKAIYCDYDDESEEDDAFAVHEDKCDEICAVTLAADGSNYADCPVNEAECSKVNEEAKFCGMYEPESLIDYPYLGYETLDSYVCTPYSNGKMYYVYTGFEPCADICNDTTKSCKVEKCSAEAAAVCTSDTLITECVAFEEGNYSWISNCAAQMESTCKADEEDGAYCSWWDEEE